MCSEESDIGFQIGALGVIGFLYATVSVCVLYPWFGWTNTFFAHEAGLTFFCVMIVYNYMSAAFTDPGSVPVNYEPDDLDIEQGLGSSDREDIARKRRARFCKRCQEYKPPRTHHCSTCGKCVLKMDHHCPWVCNCIGHNNHRYFILFLLYVTTGVGYAMVMCFIRAVQLMGMPTRERRNVPIVTAVAIGLDIFLGLVVLLGVGMLFFFQVSVIFRNMTTIESWEFDTQTRRARRKGKTHRHQYDLGTWNNLKSFFGPNPWTWWLPGKPPGTGLAFKTVHQRRSEEQSSF